MGFDSKSSGITSSKALYINYIRDTKVLVIAVSLGRFFASPLHGPCYILPNRNLVC